MEIVLRQVRLATAAIRRLSLAKKSKKGHKKNKDSRLVFLTLTIHDYDWSCSLINVPTNRKFPILIAKPRKNTEKLRKAKKTKETAGKINKKHRISKLTG